MVSVCFAPPRDRKSVWSLSRYLNFEPIHSYLNTTETALSPKMQTAFQGTLSYPPVNPIHDFPNARTYSFIRTPVGAKERHSFPSSFKVQNDERSNINSR